MIRLFLAASCVLLTLLPARAEGELDKTITENDRARLARYETVRAEALREARAGGAPQEVERLNAAMGKRGIGFDGFEMTGNWRCRVTKLGGLSPLVAYDWFRCRVSDDGSGWRLQKISGSQRTTGRFFDRDEKTLVYLGSQYVDGEAAKPYGAGPASDQVGLAFRTGAQEWRIELPAPFYESKLDIIEFRR